VHCSYFGEGNQSLRRGRKTGPTEGWLSHMRVEVLARQGSAPQYLLDHAGPRLERLDQYLSDLSNAKVTVSEHRGRFTIEITAHSARNIFRSEKTADEPLDAFDDAYRALENQVRRLKDRLRKREKMSVRKLEVAAEESEAEEDEVSPVQDTTIVRVKTHSLKPMSPQEAAMQMEMIGHDFYVFENAQSGNTAVVYRRKTTGYGLIEPKTE